MKKLLIALVAAAALAAPASALACHHHNHKGGVRLTKFTNHRGGGDNSSGTLFAKLSGTGASFGGETTTASGSIVGGNDHQNGHWSASLSTTWSSATTKSWSDPTHGTFTLSCAPSTASLTLTNGSTTTDSLTGKTCSWDANGTTTYGFFGTDSAHSVHAFLKEDSSGNVTGAVVTKTDNADNDTAQGHGGCLHLGPFAFGAHFAFPKHV